MTAAAEANMLWRSIMATNVRFRQSAPNETYDPGMRSIRVADVRPRTGVLESDPVMRAANTQQAALPPARFRGVLKSAQLSCGAILTAADLTACESVEAVCEAERSLAVLALLGNNKMNIRLGSRTLTAVPNTVSLVSIPDGEEMSIRYEKGCGSLSVLLRARPEDMVDGDLAEHIEQILRKSSTCSVALSPRAGQSARQIVSGRLSGALDTLLAESLGLELLASTIEALESNGERKTGKSSISARDRHKIIDLSERLKGNLSADYKLASLAREIGMCETSLKVKFASVMGESVFEFIRNRRLDWARQAIEREEYTIGEVAYFAGYRYASNFTAAFRRRFGITPRQARRPHDS